MEDVNPREHNIINIYIYTINNDNVPYSLGVKYRVKTGNKINGIDLFKNSTTI